MNSTKAMPNMIGCRRRSSGRPGAWHHPVSQPTGVTPAGLPCGTLGGGWMNTVCDGVLPKNDYFGFLTFSVHFYLRSIQWRPEKVFHGVVLLLLLKWRIWILVFLLLITWHRRVLQQRGPSQDDKSKGLRDDWLGGKRFLAFLKAENRTRHATHSNKYFCR